MIEAMPRARLPHLSLEHNRHGTAVWYFRIEKGPRTRLHHPYGSPEFMAEYQAALTGEKLEEKHPRGKVGSLLWLYDRYRETGSWRDNLSDATRKQRENILSHVMKTAGNEPFNKVNRKTIVAGRDRRSGTPAQARNFLDAVRGLFRWALEAGHITVDPTSGIKNPARPKGAGFPAWTEEDVSRYEARWPIGTKERVWLDVLLYTGLRRGDAVKIGRQHVSNGIATLRTEKSQGEITVTLPILPILNATLKAGPTGDLAFICGVGGEPLTKESFGNVFREASRGAGVQKSAHGVRKIGATRAAENGATVAQLEAIFGWSGGGMASLYTRAADRVRLAKEAMAMLERTTTEQNFPAPPQKVRGRSSKDKRNQKDKN